MLRKFLLFTWLLICGFTALMASNDDSNSQVLISERVILHTDRKVYIAGENLLFNFYLIDTKSNSLASYPSIGYVVIRNSKGIIYGKAQVKVGSGKAAGAIYLSDTLQSGYYQLVAYTNFMRNGSPELAYQTQILVANRFDRDFFGIITEKSVDTIDSPSHNESHIQKSYLNIINEKASYSRREKASVKVNLPGNEIKFVDFSVSIVEKNSMEDHYLNKPYISAYTRKAAFFEVSENPEQPPHLAEDNYAELEGRVTDSVSGKALVKQLVYLSTPDSVNNFKYAVTNAGGYFKFPLSDYYNGKVLYLKVKQNKGQAFRPIIKVDNKFDFNNGFNPAFFPIDSTFISYLKKSQDLVRIQKSFSLIQADYKPMQLPAFAPKLFRVPDYKVTPADYVELKDFVEIAREILPPLKVRKTGEGYIAQVFYEVKREFLNPDPVIFLDGVLIDNINQVIPFGTRDIKHVDIIASKWLIDGLSFNGVISITSHNNLWKNVNLNSDNIKVRTESYYELPPIGQPNFSIADMNSREPDFRQVLYWKPNCRVESGNSVKFEFFTSDCATTYMVKISGVTDKGEPIEAFSEIKVNE